MEDLQLPLIDLHAHLLANQPCRTNTSPSDPNRAVLAHRQLNSSYSLSRVGGQGRITLNSSARRVRRGSLALSSTFTTKASYASPSQSSR